MVSVVPNRTLLTLLLCMAFVLCRLTLQMWQGADLAAVSMQAQSSDTALGKNFLCLRPCALDVCSLEKLYNHW